MWHNLFKCAIPQLRLVNHFFSRGEAFWHISIVLWSPERQLRLLISGVRRKNQWFLVHWFENESLEFVFAGVLDWSFTYFFGPQSASLPNSLCWSGDFFERLECITTHERVEVVYLVFSSELIVDFWTRWE